MNYLLIESLQKFHHYLGDDFKVELPTGSGNYVTLTEVAAELSRRLTRIFLRDASGRRPALGFVERFQNDPHFRDLVLFHEYFHGDNGAGIGQAIRRGGPAWSSSYSNRQANDLYPVARCELLGLSSTPKSRHGPPTSCSMGPDQGDIIRCRSKSSSRHKTPSR